MILLDLAAHHHLDHSPITWTQLAFLVLLCSCLVYCALSAIGGSSRTTSEDDLDPDHS